MCTTRAIYSSFIVFLLRLFFILIAYERNVSDEREYSAYVYYVRNVKKKKKKIKNQFVACVRRLAVLGLFFNRQTRPIACNRLSRNLANT